jgi:hypothetical protein
MQDILKQLSDRSAGDLSQLNHDELSRFETLCEQWQARAETERARRTSLPRPSVGVRY